ncbi:MAG: hypothetical protein V8T46_11500 [Sutterella seckii]
MLPEKRLKASRQSVRRETLGAAAVDQAGVDFSKLERRCRQALRDHVDKAAESITGLMGHLESGQKAMVGNLGALLDALRNYQNTIDETSRLFAEAQSFEESIKKAAAAGFER